VLDLEYQRVALEFSRQDLAGVRCAIPAILHLAAKPERPMQRARHASMIKMQPQHRLPRPEAGAAEFVG